MEFRKRLAYELIKNEYLEKEGIGHGLLLQKNCWDENRHFYVQIPPPPPNAIIAKETYAPITGAPQECISAAIALQSIFMMSIMKSKDTS